MNNNEIEMPGSVKEYFSSNGIRATVDALLDQKLDDVFPGLDWNEIHDYHKALLAAATVRAEYAIFLLDVWDAVWGTAIKGTDYQSLPIDEIEKAFKPSAKGIWGDCLYRVHKKTIKSSPYLVTAVVYNGAEEGLTLFVALFQDVAGEKKHNKMASLLDTLNTLKIGRAHV